MNPVELGPTDNGRQIPVSPADTVYVRLPESGAAGYAWDLAIVGPAQVVEDHVESPGGPVAGAALVRRLRLAMQGPGRVIFRATRHNPWDDTVEEYSVELSVPSG
jgi:Chagasin family peptidase inhibitor I42